MNNVMLEICGEIVSEADGCYSGRIPDFILHKAIADKYGYPNIGLGYAHNPDSAFVVWAFNKLFGSNAWISTLTGRFGVAEEVRKTIPDEADIIQEAYDFEKRHEELFSGESSAKLAVLFSLDNLMYNGCAQRDYSQPWHDITIELFKQNIQFDVVLDIPSPDKYPVLLLSNFDCVSAEIEDRLRDYRKQGGMIIAGGLLGFRDERGQLREKPLMADMDIELRDLKYNWNIPAADLFASAKVYDPDSSTIKNGDLSYNIYHNKSSVTLDEWICVGTIHWLPEMSVACMVIKVKELLPLAGPEVSCPKGWVYRILRDNDTGKCFIHLLAMDIEAIPYQSLRNNILDEPVIESLNFNAAAGKVTIVSSGYSAVLHSPDLPESVELECIDGKYNFELSGIERYLIVELFRL